MTWPLAVGLKDARCVRACFGGLERLAELGPSYEREFRLRVDFRAGLHCGPVVVGEMGTIKREIALIGDTLNTAARIVDFARDSGERVVGSAALLNQLAMPAGVVARALGPIRLRGKKSPIELLALKADAADSGQIADGVTPPAAGTAVAGDHRRSPLRNGASAYRRLACSTPPPRRPARLAQSLAAGRWRWPAPCA